MKKYIFISILSIIQLHTLTFFIMSQECIVYPPINGVLKSTTTGDINVQKTIQVIAHFPLTAAGTGNFTETTDLFGISNQYTGYWFAEKVIERTNYYLDRNQDLDPQLSYEPPVPVLPINIDFELAGVIFHRDDDLYNTTSIYTASSYVDADNSVTAINVFFYPNSGSSRAILGDNFVYQSNTRDAYDYFIDNSYNVWWIDFYTTCSLIHEIGHCLNEEHPKRYAGGVCCINDSIVCLDNCDDTPTYLELLSDGVTDPWIWNGEGRSNNIMDYGAPRLKSWTPCQIDIAHDALEAREEIYPCGYETVNLIISADIVSQNKSYMAEHVTAFNLVVEEDHRLDIDCEEFVTFGYFEIEVGAIFDVSIAPKCN